MNRSQRRGYLLGSDPNIEVKIMKIQTWVCFLMFLLPIIVFAQGSEMNSNKAQSQVKIIADKLSNGEIMRVEIINIPSYVLTYARITPEMLEKQFHYKLTISEIRGNVHNKQLLDAIKSMTIQTKSEMKDLRWGVIFGFPRTRLFSVSPRQVLGYSSPGRARQGW